MGLLPFAGAGGLKKTGDTGNGDYILNGSSQSSSQSVLKLLQSDKSSYIANFRNNQTFTVGAASDPLGWAKFYVAGGGFRADDDFRFQKNSGAQYIARLNPSGSGGASGYDLIFQVRGDTIVMQGAGGVIFNNTSDPVNYIQFNGGNKTNSLYITTGGQVGVGINNPSSQLNIVAGTAAANTAPLQLNSGTLETTARAGVTEYNGNYYHTQGGAVRYSVGGTLFDHTADVGNSHTDGTTFDDIYSDTLAVSTFNTNGDKIRADYSGTFVSSATATRQVKVLFAGTTILATGALTTATAQSWDIDVLLIRVSSTVVRCMATIWSSTTLGASAFTDTTYTEVTGLTLSNTNVLKIQAVAGGAGAAASDIVGKLGTVIFQGAI